MHVIVAIEDVLSLLGGDLDEDAVLDEEVGSLKFLAVAEGAIIWGCLVEIGFILCSGVESTE